MRDYPNENQAVAEDMALMLYAASLLWGRLQSDAATQGAEMTHSQRQHVTQDLYRITKEVLRGAEFLKDRLEYDICIIEQRIRDHKLQGQNVSLANALGPMKRDIKSDFYTENSFNL